jgi:hypothetical protein
VTLRTQLLWGLLAAAFAVTHVVAAARLESVRHGAPSDTVMTLRGD